jgi:hypothetical protein
MHKKKTTTRKVYKVSERQLPFARSPFPLPRALNMQRAGRNFARWKINSTLRLLERHCFATMP